MTTIQHYQWIFIIAFLLFLISWIKGNRGSGSALGLIVSFIVICEVPLADLISHFSMSNWILINAYPPVYIIWLSLLFRKRTAKSRITIYLDVMLAIWLIVTIASFLIYDATSLLFTRQYVGGLSVLSLYIILYLRTLSKDMFTKITNDPYLYVGIGTLFFYVVSFTILIFATAILTNEQLRKVWPLLSYGNILFALGFFAAAIAFYKPPQNAVLQ